MSDEHAKVMFSGIAWNSIWYGCKTIDGTTAWSNYRDEIVKYPSRLRSEPILRKPFSEVRQLLLRSKKVRDLCA